MTDYKNKRGIPSVAEIAAIKPSLNNAKTTVTATSSVTRPSSAKTDNFKPAITTANNLKSAKTAVAAEKAAKRRRIEEKKTEKAATLEYDTIFSGFGITMKF